MASKVKIKAGGIEIEFEGSEEYMKEDLPTLVELLHSISPGLEDSSKEDEPDELPASTDASKKKLQMTTNTIAARLNVKKAGELILAACAHLSLVKGRETFTRNNILAEMKLASNYYKESMRSNMSGSLKTLVRNNIILETSTDTYAIQAETKSNLEEKLNAN